MFEADPADSARLEYDIAVRKHMQYMHFTGAREKTVGIRC